MTFGDFIKDELSSILLQILCAIILTIYLCSLSLDIGECVLILIAWIVIASLYYFYKYYADRSHVVARQPVAATISRAGANRTNGRALV